MTHVRADAPAAFLAWGEDDTVVARRSIAALEPALRKAGAKVEVKTYPGVGHIELMLALSRPFRRKAPLLADMTAFFRAHADD